ncbi:hypothetical protein TrVE_jg9824 [Triparma verrucosa]|uniref:CW-type domain-containing protein n=1 Tax=Triparma verrucosa TaxID=1606542 RepID=A0A9W7F5J0_9STRA|nr:hypothetical protein TrVE_jg9824 [Triparma verrucosa]
MHTLRGPCGSIDEGSGRRLTWFGLIILRVDTISVQIIDAGIIHENLIPNHLGLKMDANDNINWAAMERLPSETASAVVSQVHAPGYVTQFNHSTVPHPTTTAPSSVPNPTFISAPTPVVQEIEWVACDICEKWHELPPSVPATSLPSNWLCKNNFWDEANAFCRVASDPPQIFNDLEIGAGAPPPVDEEAPKIIYKDDLEDEDEEDDPEPNDDDDEEYSDRSYYQKKKKKQRVD